MFQSLPQNRRSHRRLIIAMGLSSMLVVALLTAFGLVFVDPACPNSICSNKQHELTVQLEQRTTGSVVEIEVPDHERRVVRQEAVTPAESDVAVAEKSNTESVATDVEEPVDEQESTRDWYAIAREPVRQSIDDYFDNEETRKKMWRQTGSVMFRDTGEFDFKEPETIIAARKFRRPVGVLGLGFAIGGCFFGVPLAGVPVEERGVGPNIFYCTDIYD